MNKKNAFLIYFILISQIILAQFAINKAINKFVSDDDLINASISICVIDVQTGTLIAAYNPDRTLTPASSMKVITTSTALGILSPDYVFKTEIQYDGELNLQTGVLDGNIYMKGFGDPTLGSPDMETAANLSTVVDNFGAAINKLGISKINGRVIGDGTFFSSIDGIGMNWQWDDIGNSYGAGIYGLNINENYFQINLQQTPILNAQPQIIGTNPIIPDLSFINLLTSANGGGDNSLILTAPFSDECALRGTIPTGSGIYKVKAAMPDPISAAAYFLHQKLKKDYKIDIRKKPINLEDAHNTFLPRKTIFTQYSPKLSAIVEKMNLESVNLYAEAMLRTIAQVSVNKSEPSAGAEVVKNYWQSKGVNLSGFFMEDGSGLSARSAVSSKHLASILRAAALDNVIATPLYNSLPKAGETGTLRNMFKATKAIGKIRAKSGSMTRVRSYSGYVNKPDGSQWSFSFIVNNYNCSSSQMREKLEELMVALCE